MTKIRKPVAKLTKLAKLKMPKSKFRMPKAPKLSALTRKRWGI